MLPLNLSEYIHPSTASKQTLSETQRCLRDKVNQIHILSPDIQHAAIMQVLWSRAQARASCRCGSCLHAAIARRTTTAASKRRLRVSDVFTACYSTILATAAFADAKVKEDRRKEWDRVIAEAKAEVPMNEPASIEGAHSQQASDSLGSELPSIRNLSRAADESRSKTCKAWGGIGWAIPPRMKETSLESKLRILDSQLKEISSSAKILPELEVVDSTSSDSGLDHEWIETPDVQLPPREPKQKLHLDKMEEMVANLVDRLLHRTNIHSVQSSAALARDDIQQQMNDIAQRIDSLKKGFTRLPAYSWDDVKSVEEQRCALHRSLRALCRRATPSKSSIDLMLAKICYNLLICTAPPSISTYNLLLWELNRLRQPELAQIIVDSFLHESRFKPNKVTGRLILDHYRIKKDPSGFSATTKQMGGHLKSMRIKRRHTSTFSVPAVQEWALANKVILRGAHLYQKMLRDTATFNSLIRGSLEMHGVRSAIRYVRAALREGYEITSKTLCTIIKACLTQLDTQAGISLLRAILLWTERTDFSTTLYSKKVRYHIHELLSLCGVSSSPSLQKVLPPRMSRDVLEKMLRNMKIEYIRESVEQLSKRISSVKDVLCVTGTQISTNLLQNDSARPDHDRVTRAIELLKRQDPRDMVCAGKKQKRAAARRWVRLQCLESMLVTHEEQITASQGQLLPIIFARLSTERKDRYLDAIKLSRHNGHVVSMSDRFELLSQLLRVEAILPVPKVDLGPSKVESQPDLSLDRTIKKIPSPTDAVKSQHLISLLPIISVSKPEIRAVAP